jgi:hypothetical protein
MLFVGAENTDSWQARKGDLQRAFRVDILMVHSSTLVFATDGECLTCSGSSLGETICLGSLEFIIDHFDNHSLSPEGSDSGAITTCHS